MLFPIIIIYNSVIKISTRNNYTFNYTIFKIYISLSQNKQYVCLYSVVATGDGVGNHSCIAVTKLRLRYIT